MNTNDFDFHLPEELIAQTPLEKRDASKLLILNRQTGQMEDQHFDAIINELEPGDALVMNNTRVLPARLHGCRLPHRSAFPVRFCVPARSRVLRSLIFHRQQVLLLSRFLS